MKKIIIGIIILLVAIGCIFGAYFAATNRVGEVTHYYMDEDHSIVILATGDPSETIYVVN